MSITRNLTRLFFVVAVAVMSGTGAREVFAAEEVQPGAPCAEGDRHLCYTIYHADGDYTEYFYRDD